MTSIVELASSGQAENVAREMRVRSLYSPYYFAKVVLGYTKLTDHFHQEEMERFATRWSEGKTLQVVEWARAFYKTTSFTLACSIWKVLPVHYEDTVYAVEKLGISEDEWLKRVGIHDQDATQLLAFETAPNAEKKVGQIKWHFEENELFRGIFPEIAYNGSEPKWNQKCLILRRVGDRRKDLEGSFEAIGVGGALQSRHYTTVWEDDLVGEGARKSEAVMQDTIGWHQRLHGAFENADRQERFVVANRWGYSDLNSHIRSKEPEFIFHTRSAYELIDGIETPTFPEEYPMEALMKLKGKMSSYDFSCQYLNNPVLPGEAEINLKSLHTYAVEEDGSMVCSCGAKWRLSQCLRFLVFDPYNAKGAGSKSCPALAVVATAPDKHVFLVDYCMNRGNYGKVYEQLFSFNDHFRPLKFSYEDVGHQNMVEYHIRQIAQTVGYKEKHKNFPQIVALKTGNRSKEIRIRENLFPVIEKGKFSRRASHVTFDSMIETFPNARLDDDYDLLDALAQAPLIWRFPESEDTRLAAREKEDEYLAQVGKPYSAGVLA